MEGFHYRNQALYVDDIPVKRLAEKFGTPLYVYSASEIKNRYISLSDAIYSVVPEGTNALIAYACKANSNIALLKLLAGQGAGADVVSLGELKRARYAGIPANKIVFSGVGKTTEEIEHALLEGILQLNVESESEYREIVRLAEKNSCTARIAFRINPDVDAHTHEKITTGKAENKFGIPLECVKRLYAEARENIWIEPKGLSMHIGSQLTSLQPFEDAFQKLAQFVRQLRENNCPVEQLDIGGGLGIIYSDETPLDLQAYAKLIEQHILPLETDIILEPGRFLMADGGILVSRATYVKRESKKDYVILDAGMNDLMRPSLYDAYHPLWPVEKRKDAKESVFDIVGPVCETGDTFHENLKLQDVEQGDYLAFLKAGAYCAVMGSFYNARSLPAEVLVEGNEYEKIRDPITLQDIMEKETIPDWI